MRSHHRILAYHRLAYGILEVRQCVWVAARDIPCCPDMGRKWIVRIRREAEYHGHVDGKCVEYDTVHVGAQFLESTEVVVVTFQGHSQHHLRRVATRTDLVGTRPVAHDSSEERSHFFVVVGTGATVHNVGTNAKETNVDHVGGGASASQGVASSSQDDGMGACTGSAGGGRRLDGGGPAPFPSVVG